WGPVPALATQLAAVAAVTWRRRLPALGGVLVGLQFVVSFLAAEAVILAGDPDVGPSGLAWVDLDDALIVVSAIAAWLITFGLASVAVERLGRRYAIWRVPPGPLWYVLLFNAALVVLSPILAATAQSNVAFVPLM